jgi:hypothetical protein
MAPWCLCKQNEAAERIEFRNNHNQSFIIGKTTKKCPQLFKNTIKCPQLIQKYKKVPMSDFDIESDNDELDDSAQSLD